MAAVKLFVVSYSRGKMRTFHREGMNADAARALAKYLSMQGLRASVHRFDLEDRELWRIIDRLGQVTNIRVKPR
jgi:hypothetical protein